MAGVERRQDLFAARLVLQVLRQIVLEVDHQLDLLRQGAGRGANLIPLLMDCARADATLGEMVSALRSVFGEFVEPVS